MNDLLSAVLDAHGGIGRWLRQERVEATIVSGGGLFALRGTQHDPTPQRMAVWFHEGRLSVVPFGTSGPLPIFASDRLTVDTCEGKPFAGRQGLGDSLAGHQIDAQWDTLQRAYFNDEALWTYMTTPFLLAMDGVWVEEVEPWSEAGETWRVLRAQFPASFETHSMVQDFFFGKDLMLRRHDYNVDVAEGLSATQLMSDYVVADGFHLPAKRRAYVRGPDRRPVTDLLLVSIDLSDIGFFTTS